MSGDLANRRRTSRIRPNGHGCPPTSPTVIGNIRWAPQPRTCSAHLDTSCTVFILITAHHYTATTTDASSEFESISEGVSKYLAWPLYARNKYFINSQGTTKEYNILKWVFS